MALFDELPLYGTTCIPPCLPLRGELFEFQGLHQNWTSTETALGRDMRGIPYPTYANRLTCVVL